MNTEAALVRHILANSDNFYAVLGVQRSASDAEIKQAYKVLALKVHPDKCKLPQAEEAFKAIGRAHAVLADAEKRRVYDRHGSEGVQQQESGATPGAQERRPHAYRQQEDVFEDVFAAFMGGPMRRRRDPERQGGNANPGMIMLLPIALFFLFAMMMTSNTTFDVGSVDYDQIFSLRRDTYNGFTNERFTNYPGLPQVAYFVRSTFYRDVNRVGLSSRQVEAAVVNAHMQYLKRRCDSDKRQRRGSADRESASCTELRRFEAA